MFTETVILDSITNEISDSNIVDTINVPVEPPITQKPITNVFPNPANEVLYYYHNQVDTTNGFNESIGYILNLTTHNTTKTLDYTNKTNF